MRIAVVGAGAMGGFYGALLARSGCEVHFLMRRDYEAVRRRGLMVRSVWGDFHLERVNCYREAGEMPAAEVVFIGLKTTANGRYGELVGPLMGPNSLALTAQNGLGNEEQLAGLFGAERVAGGLAFLCANRGEAGVIEHLDYGQLTVGNWGRGPDERLREFARLAERAGVRCDLTEDLALSRWKKLVWNVPFNGLSALLDVTVDQLAREGRVRRRAERLMAEVQAAAAAEGHAIEDGYAAYMWELTEKMRPYYTSMQLDRRRHEPMEVESILGEPLRRGRERGVALPEMTALYEELRALDEANRRAR